MFLERYNHIKIPQVTVESLLDMKQGPTKRTRAYIYRFTRVMRKIKNSFDELALITLKRGLRNDDPGTLKYDSYRKNCKAFNKFVNFVEGYMRGEDNTKPPQRASRSPSPRARKGYNPTKRDNKSQDFRNEGRGDGHKRGKLNIDAEYSSYFTSYAQFDLPTQDLLKLINRKFDLPRPIDIHMFEIRDENNYCQYHRSKGLPTILRYLGENF
jgi:hypothetical protein